MVLGKLPGDGLPEGRQGQEKRAGVRSRAGDDQALGDRRRDRAVERPALVCDLRRGCRGKPRDVVWLAAGPVRGGAAADDLGRHRGRPRRRSGGLHARRLLLDRRDFVLRELGAQHRQRPAGRRLLHVADPAPLPAEEPDGGGQVRLYFPPFFLFFFPFNFFLLLPFPSLFL